METLKQYLAAEGISQIEFARRIEDSLQNINRYVNGRIPHWRKIITIKDATAGRVTFESWIKQKHEEFIKRGESELTNKRLKARSAPGQFKKQQRDMKVL